MPLLSIIIPVYNAELTIRNTLDSVLQSDFSDYEIICVDDGSSDSSHKILSDYSNNYSQITTVHTENKGVSHARNTGMDRAAGDYIAFVDADDTISANMYTDMLRFSRENGLDCAVSGINKIYKNHSKSTPLVKSDTVLAGYDEILERVIKPLLGYPCLDIAVSSSVNNKIFTKTIITENNIRFNEKRTAAEDWQFVIEYYRYCNRIGFMANIYYNYIRTFSGTLVNRYSEWYEVSLENHILFSTLFPFINSEPDKTSYLLKPMKAVGNVYIYYMGRDADAKVRNIFGLVKKYKVYEGEIPADCPKKQSAVIKKLKNAVIKDDYNAFKNISMQNSKKQILTGRLKRMAKKIIAR